MRRRLAVLVMIAVAGCSPTGGSTSAPGPTPAHRIPLSEPEQKAVDAARMLLDGHKLSWGDPEKIDLTAGGKTNWLTYRTPEKEIQVLGPRVVTVDVKTGEAKLLMRD